MENRARYLLVGIFASAAIVAIFGFVYWLNASDGFRSRAYYRVLYHNSVAGLLIGSPVQFNGVRVGEVTAIDLNPATPTDIAVRIAVAPETPIRTDTKVGIAFQELMGSPAVALSGGSPSGSKFDTAAAAVPTLEASPGAGESVTESAVAVLHRLDGILSDNAEPLRATIKNVKEFSDALARNSNRVDNIVAGVERMTGTGAKAAGPVFALSPAVAVLDKPPGGLLIVAYPTAPAALAQDKIMVRDGQALRSLSPDAKWDDMLPEKIQSKLVQSFEKSRFVVSRPIEGVTGDFQLMIDVQEFSVAAARGEADVALSTRIVNNEGRLLDSHIFQASAPMHGDDAAGAAAALDHAFQLCVSELVSWTAKAMTKTAEAVR